MTERQPSAAKRRGPRLRVTPTRLTGEAAIKAAVLGYKRPEVIADKTGRRYGKILVLELAPPSGHQAQWRVRCDCGTEKIMSSVRLTEGDATACGVSECRFGPTFSENPTITCACGCGGTLPRFADGDIRHRRPRTALANHLNDRNRPWLERDDQTLRALYRSIPVAALSAQLRRSIPRAA